MADLAMEGLRFHAGEQVLKLKRKLIGSLIAICVALFFLGVAVSRRNQDGRFSVSAPLVEICLAFVAIFGGTWFLSAATGESTRMMTITHIFFSLFTGFSILVPSLLTWNYFEKAPSSPTLSLVAILGLHPFPILLRKVHHFRTIFFRHHYFKSSFFLTYYYI